MWLIIRNVTWAANQHIIMISGGSCDTKNHRNKLHFKIILKSAVLNVKSNIKSNVYFEILLFVLF